MKDTDHIDSLSKRLRQISRPEFPASLHVRIIDRIDRYQCRRRRFIALGCGAGILVGLGSILEIVNWICRTYDPEFDLFSLFNSSYRITSSVRRQIAEILSGQATYLLCFAIILVFYFLINRLLDRIQ